MKQKNRRSTSPSLGLSRRNFEPRLHAYSDLSAAAVVAAGALSLGATEATAQSIVNLTFGGTLPSLAISPPLTGLRNDHQFNFATFAVGAGASVVMRLGQGNNGSGSFYVKGWADIANRYGDAHRVDFAGAMGGGYFQAGKISPGNPINGLAWNPVSFGANAFRTGMAASGPAYQPGLNPVGNFQPTAAGAGGRASGYIGFRVQVTGGYNYGWLHVQVGKDANGRPAFIGITPGPNTGGIAGAYNSALNGAMTAGATAIPEPASVATGLALFALGAVGVREHRRRKLAAAA